MTPFPVHVLAANCYVWDLLRSCYYSSMRFAAGSIPQPGRWQWCPPRPKVLPFSIAFGSSNWDADKAYVPTIGEVGRPARNWYNGGPGTPCPVQVITGPVQWWHTGVPASQFNEFCWPASGGLVFYGSAVAKPAIRVAFATGGNYTWTCPPGVTSVIVECWGAGATAFRPTNTTPPISGGGGAYARSVLAVVPGTTYPLYVGIGSLGLPPANGQTWFGPGPLILADCGGHRAAIQNINPGLAANCIAQVAFDGGFGAFSPNLPNRGGGGGGGAGINGPGQYPFGTITTAGGRAGPGGGNGGNGSGSPHGPQPGFSPGGGGGGPVAIATLIHGADGMVVVSYFV